MEANAYNYAQKIYSQHCPSYQKSKATVSSVNGVRTTNKKEQVQVAQDLKPIETSTPNDPQPTITKAIAFEMLRSMLQPLRDI